MTGIAAAIAAGVAVAGLQTWKRQLQGTAAYDVSRRLLRSVYRLREEIRALRSPFMSAGEIASAMKAAGIEPPQSGTPGKDSQEAAYNVRWRRVADAQTAFAAEVLEAEALWGGGIRPWADELFGCTGQLHFSLGRWVSPRSQMLSDEQDRKLMGIVYDGDDPPSEFTSKLNAAFEGIENEVRSRLTK